MADITIFTARRIITMNPAIPEATAVAVKGDRILGVGSVEELAEWGDHVVDDSFADQVLVPGFVEAHSHAVTAGWDYPYIGRFDRTKVDGTPTPGCSSVAEVLDRLREAEAAMDDPDETMIATGFDPIYFEDHRLTAADLDTVSATRPILIAHVSGHICTVNSALMHAEDITADTETPGVLKGDDGEPNGELRSPAAMSLARTAWRKLRGTPGGESAMWSYAIDGCNTGHTLLTDLGGTMFEESVLDEWDRVTSDPEFPVRVMMAGRALLGSMSSEDLAATITERMESSSGNAKLHFGIVKLVIDGSIQGFTARLNWPYYYNAPEGNAENGLWYLAPEQLPDVLELFHRAGLTVHVHCNGDQATEVFIDAVEEVLERHPRWDHRHTVQHCQLTTPAQYKRMKALGMCANIFSNHIFFWGDQHAKFTVGPERAARMDACATAEREGVPFSFHSDSGVTPLGHLHVMWCAVNRLTASGQVLGPDERISVQSALHAATLGAAYQLKLDHEVGSIEAGKYADFAVLESDPYEVEPTTLKDIVVWGTVLGGKPHRSKIGV